MSQRQPTIEIDNQIIARDEIICLVDTNDTIPSKDRPANSEANAIKLVDGTILPLPPHKIKSVINFICRNEY